jgi:hypothetical protein
MPKNHPRPKFWSNIRKLNEKRNLKRSRRNREDSLQAIQNTRNSYASGRG